MAILGFAPIQLGHRVNDKVLHFSAFFLLGSCLYFLWNLSYKRNLLLASIILFVTAFGSEYLQKLLPYRTFDIQDIMANLMGGSCGLSCAFVLDYALSWRQEHRRRWGGKKEAEYQRALMDDVDLEAEEEVEMGK
ncbi:hypothetical protein DFQ28_000631 [Apophysomyces sp. BC1034]|nr:hypothetical protein DFQ29_000543 [Apophysomyces sp. BC1021]KAG0183900.1 hypothetical protein DFQ28_000631 [Apophysomyces sp. BC1034]